MKVRKVLSWLAAILLAGSTADLFYRMINHRELAFIVPKISFSLILLVTSMFENRWLGKQVPAV